MTDDILDKDPTTDISVEVHQPEIQDVTPNEVRLLQQHIGNGLELLVECLHQSGLRIGGAQALRAKDFMPRIINWYHSGHILKVRRSLAEIQRQPSIRDHGKTRSSTRRSDRAHELGTDQGRCESAGRETGWHCMEVRATRPLPR